MNKFVAFLAIAFASLFTLTTVQAETFATLPNAAGGQVRLTDNFGGCKEGFKMAMTTTPSGEFMTGCWTLAENDILVIYENGGRRLYPIVDFTLIGKAAVQTKKGSL
jgi:hypothetical protein